MKKFSVFAVLAAALALGACEFTRNAVAPSITGQTSSAAAGVASTQPAAIVPLDVAKLGTPGGTSAGARIAQFRDDLVQLQQASVEHILRQRQLHADAEASIANYQIAVGTIKTRQQGGTAPGDSASVDAWQRAQATLQMLGADLDQMNALAGTVANNVTFAAFLLQSIRAAASATGAAEEGRRQLGVLEESAAQTAASLDQLLDGLRADILRQSHFLGVERANLAQMAPAGNSAQASAAPGPASSAQPASAPGAGLGSGRPFVVIRFDRSDVEYEQQLYEAVSTALARRPNVAFDLVAVASAVGTPDELALNSDIARTNANKVMRSLLDMGLPADRISLSQVTDPNIQASEVHLYVR